MAKVKEEKILQANEAPAEGNLTERSFDSAQDDKKAEDANAENPSQSPSETALPGESPTTSFGNTELKAGPPTMAELIAAEKKRMEEYVTIELLKDDDKYKDDVYVSVNGANCLVQRGVPVRIKRKFAMELAKSQHEDQRTAARIALLAEK